MKRGTISHRLKRWCAVLAGFGGAFALGWSLQTSDPVIRQQTERMLDARRLGLTIPE